MAESVTEGLRAEVKALRDKQAAAAAAERASLDDKADQLKARDLRRERNILQGKLPDAGEEQAAPAALAPTVEPDAPKEGKK